MPKIWYCATCGYEVDARGRCHRCKQKLVASPLPPLPAGDEDAEVGYRIADWEDRARGRLIEALVAGGIAHRFEDDDLVVGVDDEDAVDRMVEELAEVAEDDQPFIAGSSADGLLDDVGEDTVAAVEMMFRAAQRLRVDPTDMEADGDVAESSTGVFMSEGFPGLDAEEWAAVGRVTRALLAALGAEEALEDEIRRQAAVLATLLRPALAEHAAGVAEPAAVLPEPPVVLPGAPAGAATPSDAVVGDPVAVADDDEARSAAEALDPTPEEPALASDEAVEDPAPVADDEGAKLLGRGPETSYEVPDWMPEQRALLTVLLEERAIPYAWDGSDLVVPSADEEVVEGLFDQIGGAADDEDDETRYRAIEELFATVGRLAGDPDDKERIADVLAASSAVEGPTPLGFDDGKWLALRRRTRTLADALEHNADPDVVESQATSLRDALRELV